MSSAMLPLLPRRYRAKRDPTSDVSRAVVQLPPMSGGTSFDVSPTGGITKIVFQIPNRSGSFWAANYTQFVGNITVNVTSTNGADTYALIQPQVDLTASL